MMRGVTLLCLLASLLLASSRAHAQKSADIPLSASDRHGRACPGHLNRHSAATDGRDKPGQDGISERRGRRWFEPLVILDHLCVFAPARIQALAGRAAAVLSFQLEVAGQGGCSHATRT